MTDRILVPLGDGYTSLLDAEDEPLLAGLNWRPLRLKHNVYAHAWRKSEHLYLHRLVTGVSNPKILVDHRDSNGLNNTRENLRLAPRGGFSVAASRKVRGPRGENPRTSKFKGVIWERGRNRWRAATTVHGETKFFGRFASEEEAARAYDRGALEIWGEFAGLNFPESAE